MIAKFFGDGNSTSSVMCAERVDRYVRNYERYESTKEKILLMRVVFSILTAL